MRKAYCVPYPGLHKRSGVYAACIGVLAPRVLVDPAVHGQPGEQALVAHELAHAEGMHGLKYILSLLIGCILTAGVAFAFLAHAQLRLCAYHFIGFGSFPICWWVMHFFWLRECEIEADARALMATDARTFVSFLLLHPHPKGRWGRFLYGKSTTARAKRVLPGEGS